MKNIVTLLLAAIAICGFNASGKSIKRPDTYAYTRGVEAYNEDKNQDAMEWFEREISDHPDNGYAYVYISSLRYINNEYGKAITAADNAIRRLPKNDKEWRALAYGVRADVYAAMEDTVSALADLAQAIKIDASTSKYYSKRAQLYYEQQKYALADDDYRRMVDLDPGSVDGYMGIGRNANAEKRWDDALSQFNRVIKLAPDYSSGYSFRAETYLALRKYNEAVDDIIKALDIDGDDKAFYMLPEVPADAYPILKSKLKIQMAKQATNAYWPYCLSVVEYSRDNYSEAIEYCQKANAIDANSIFLERISSCYALMFDYDRALDYVDRALAMNTEDYDLVRLKAEILGGMGRHDECLAERDKYVERYPESVMAYLNRALDLMKAHRFDKAIEDYNTAVVVSPELAELSYFLVQRADAYRLGGSSAEAVADYNRILELNKDSVPNQFVAFAYSGLGDSENAIAAMQYVLDNDTTDVSGNLYNMACVYSRLGRCDDAIQALRQAVDKGYKNVGLLRNDYDFDAIRPLPAYRELLSSLVESVSSNVGSAANDADDGTYEVVEVPFTKDGGVTKVKCMINGLPLHFVFDTGAADVTISMVEANFMLKNDYIKQQDIIGSARYVDANGDINEGTVINLRQVDFGGLQLDNVRASVVRNQRAPLLLGQSVLGRLGKIEIDNPGMKLKITHKASK